MAHGKRRIEGAAAVQDALEPASMAPRR